MQGQGVLVSDLGAAIQDLEPQCAASCAERADRLETVVPALEQNIQCSEMALGDGRRFTSISRTFHHVFVDFAQNQTLRLVVRSLVAVWSIQEEAWANTMEGEGRYPDVDQQRDVLAAHRGIARLIARGESAKVATVARAHLAATQPRVLQFFGTRAVDASSAEAVRGFRSL
jgi:GntR family transcriptional repressor for pyruvate dehydrogenase complex